MSTELIWITVVVNAVIALITIANTWALALYTNKRADERENKKADEAEGAHLSSAKQRNATVPAKLLVLCSIGGIVLLFLRPMANVNLQIILISLFVAYAFFGIVISLIVALANAVFRSNQRQLEHVQLTTRLSKVVEKIAFPQNGKHEP